jgi:hypothetical protein
MGPRELIARIERVFEHRLIPDEVVEMKGRLQVDSDVEDALWFEGRDWRELTCEDWDKRHWGFIFLNPRSFAYYLPSILVLTVQDPRNCPILAVDSFVWQLDHSPGVENLDLPLRERYLELSNEEFEVIKEWLLWACENVPGVFIGASSGGSGDGFGRAFDALLLLQADAEKSRNRNESD